jgi:hypothetical protein
MPPSTATGPTDADVSAAAFASRFPLHVDERSRLMNAAGLLLAEPAAPPTQLDLSPDQRLEAMAAIGARWIDRETIARLARPLLASRGAYVSAHGTETGHSVIKLELIALAICREAERRAPAGPSPARARVARLLREIYAAEPTAPEVARAFEALARFAAIGTAPDVPFVALCATHLSGPGLATIRFGAQAGVAP